jgi:ribonuclease HI
LGDKKWVNQRMELNAAIEALKVLKEPCNVVLNSESAYILIAFSSNSKIVERRNV